MTLQQLHYVITVCETGSINRAAELLFVSQPSLTSAIKALEKEAGIVIFRRSGKGVTLTNDGTEFLQYARQVYQQYESLQERFIKSGNVKKKFCVSAQHYSFAVKAFVETVKQFDTHEYEFAIRETKTLDVINDVGSLKSEVGLLYTNDFNRKSIMKLLNISNIEFHSLVCCRTYVYLWRGHPLANQKSIRFDSLESYPCISFEQGEGGAFYLAEEMLSTNNYPRIIKVCDRATALNLMVGLNAYTICSGIICEELNGNDYVAVELKYDDSSGKDEIEIGYIIKKNSILSNLGNTYINELKKYLG